MIVEFIGSTGAGKSTLIKAVHKELSKTVPVSTSFEIIASPLGLQGVKNPTARNFIQEIFGLPSFIRSIWRYRDFILFNLRILRQHKIFTIYMLNNLRSLERKIAIYATINRRESEQIILVDEGVVLQSHHLFVYTDTDYSQEEISTFARLCPMPDLLVYIQAPLDQLIERSLKRPDPPRPIKTKEPALNEKYIRQAVTMFEHLINTEQLRDRTLLIDNPDMPEKNNIELAVRIAQEIIGHERESKFSHD